VPSTRRRASRRQESFVEGPDSRCGGPQGGLAATQPVRSPSTQNRSIRPSSCAEGRHSNPIQSKPRFWCPDILLKGPWPSQVHPCQACVRPSRRGLASSPPLRAAHRLQTTPHLRGEGQRLSRASPEPQCEARCCHRPPVL